LITSTTRIPTTDLIFNKIKYDFSNNEEQYMDLFKRKQAIDWFNSFKKYSHK
jgi:hypothetical protein